MSLIKWKVTLIMLVAVAAVSMGEAMLAKGMRNSNGLTGSLWSQICGIATNVHVIGGTLLMMVFYILYMLALRWADLSFVLPITALSYLLGAFLARSYLGETVTPTRWVGAAVITLGVVIVGLGEAGGTHTP